MLDTDPSAIAETESAQDEEPIALAGPQEEAAGNGAFAAEDAAALAAAYAPPIPTVEEPSLTGGLDADAMTALGVLPIKPIPLPILKAPTYGTYRSSLVAPFQVELRIDVDGPTATRRVSADYYSVAGATRTYFGSMRLDAPAIAVTATSITITGLGAYTWGAAAPRVRITIPRVAITSSPASVTLRHETLGGAPASTYICAFAARAFRQVLLEQDRQDTVAAPFASYNTGSLPSGGPARTLTINAAYAEAGVAMLTTGGMGVVNTTEAGANARWSDAELHAAMQRHFSLWREVPQWAVWLFHAFEHDLGAGLLGIMFDQQGKQRQGAAVFYRGLAGVTATQRRLQVYTCVHELGHCFNLLHSWQKSLASPPQPDRPTSPSWMNYPWRFPGGEAAFWSAFGFKFDAAELVHIRHGFRDNVIMGGKPFGTGAALEFEHGWRDPEQDDSGLVLELSAPATFPYGAPVSVDVSLGATSGKVVSPHIRPRNGTVEIAVERPNGSAIVYRPLMHHCQPDTDTIRIGPDTAPVRETAFIHYGQDGFVFDQPGFYRVRARYTAPDGSIVLSNVIRLRVRPPLSKEDDEVAELFFGDEQGTLLYLVGSDYEGLFRGNEALTQVVAEHPHHELAPYARIVLGANAAREFKQVYADNTVEVRPAKPREAAQLLSPVLDVGAMRKEAAAKIEEHPIAAMTDAASRMFQAPAKASVGDDVAAYVRARRREIATEVIAH